MSAKEPVTVEVEVRELSPDLARDLRAVAAREDDGARLDRPRSIAPLAALLLGAVALGWIAVLVARGAGAPVGWRSCEAWDSDARLTVTVLSALGLALAASGAAALIRRRAGLDSFWAVAQGHLVDVRFDRARLYPLRALEVLPDPPEQELLLAFGEARITLDLRARGGRAFAKQLGRAIEEAKAQPRDPRAGYREDGRRARGAAAPTAKPRSTLGRALLTAAIAAAIGALSGVLVLPRLRALRAEICLAAACTEGRARAACDAYATRYPEGRARAAVDDAYFALAGARLPDLDAYAAAFPRGRHAEEVGAARRALFRRSITSSGSIHPVIEGALDALASARAGHERGTTVYLRFSHEVTRRRLTNAEILALEERSRGDGPPLTTLIDAVAAQRGQDPLEILFPEDRMSPPSESAFPDDAARAHEEQLATELTRELGQGAWALGLRFVRADDRGAPEDALAVLDLHYQVKQQRSLIGKSGDPNGLPTTEEARRGSFWEMSFDFEIRAARPALAGAPPLLINTYPPRDLTCVARADLYTAQRRAAFRLLTERLSRELGLKIERDRSCPFAEESPR